MSARTLLPSLVSSVRPIVAAAPDDLSGPSPCHDFDLRGLVNHVVGTTGGLARLGRGEDLDTDDPWGQRTDASSGEWRLLLVSRLDAVADAWSDPASWEGTLDLGAQMPASMVGDMAFIEMLLHGWDLSAATGQAVEFDADVAAEAHRIMIETGAMGRELGAYGPLVEVPTDAPLLNQALGLAGRDPAWSA